MTPPRVLVISSCTGLKTTDGADGLACADFARGRSYIEGRHRRDLRLALRPAEDLYRGQQHVRLMRGVLAARQSGALEVDLRIVSAGYGLVRADQTLAPYECTFQNMTRSSQRAWAHRLAIPREVRRALATRSALTVVLLGEDYLAACDLTAPLELGAPTLVLCGTRSAVALPAVPNLHPIALKTSHTRAFSCGLVGLKGEVAGRLLAYLSEHPEQIATLKPCTLLDRLAAFSPAVDAGSPALALF